LETKPDGSQEAADLVSYPDGTFQNWKLKPDGSQEAELRTFPSGTTIQNWKQNSDGSQEADLVTLKGDKTQYIGFRLKNSTESYSGVAFVTALGVGVTLNFPSRKSLDEAKKAVFTDKYIDEKDRELSELKQQLSYLRAQLAQKAEKEPHKRKAPDAEDIETKNTNKISKPST